MLYSLTTCFKKAKRKVQQTRMVTGLFGGELGIRTLGSLWEHSISSHLRKTEVSGIWRKITADARTPKMPCFQGFAHPFASKTQRKSESESLLRFCRVLTDFRKSLLEFLIEPSDFSPQNHAFGSAWKAPVMPNCTQSRVGKCRGEIKTAVIGKNISEIDFARLIFCR